MKKISFIRLFIIIAQVLLIVSAVLFVIEGSYEKATWELAGLILNILVCGSMGNGVDK